MTRLLAILGRLFVILGGYVCAALAASTFLHVLLFATSGFTASEMPAMILGSAIFSIPFVALFVAYFAFPASAAAILVAEYFGFRRWLYYGLAGGGIGASIVAMMWNFGASDRMGFEMKDLGLRSDTQPDQPFVLVIIAGGTVAGLAYWLVAGRLTEAWYRRASC